MHFHGTQMGQFLFCQLFDPVNGRQNWKSWERCGENLDYQ
jgi:hypothetical protein